MNTKQLIVLWYVGFIVLVLLAVDGLGIKDLQSSESAKFSLATIIFGSLVIFTQRSSLQFDKRTFFKWMSIPAAALVGLFIWAIYLLQTKEHEVRVPLNEVAKITGTASLYSGLGEENFSGDLYNGTNYDLRSIVIEITAKENNGKTRWTRQFSDDVFISPLTTGTFSVKVVDAKGAKLSWSLSEATGMRKESAR